MDVVIPRVGSINGFCVIPTQDWDAIRSRVSLVLSEQAIASYIQKDIPNFAKLVSACTTWNASAFPTIVQQTVATADFAGLAVSTLGKVKVRLDGLGAADPVPADVAYLVTVQFKALEGTAREIAERLDAITPAVDDFLTQNMTTDEALEDLTSGLDPAWQSITGPLGGLDAAAADVVMSWDMLVRALGDDTSAKIELTTVAQLSSQLDAAVTDWQALHDEAVAFGAWAGG